HRGRGERLGEENGEEGTRRAAPVELRRFLDLARDGGVEAAVDEQAERNADGGIDQHHSRARVVEIQRVEKAVDGNEVHLEGEKGAAVDDQEQGEIELWPET